MITGTRCRAALLPVHPAGRRTYMLVALLMLAALPASTVGATTTYADPQARFSVQLPDSWQRDSGAENPGLLVQYITHDPDGAFNVTATPLPDGVTIDTAVPLISARLRQQYRDYQETNIGPASVAGESGAELDYTATSGDGTLIAVSQVLVQHNGTLYLLTLAARPQDLGAVQAIAAPILPSWQWLS